MSILQTQPICISGPCIYSENNYFKLYHILYIQRVLIHSKPDKMCAADLKKASWSFW